MLLQEHHSSEAQCDKYEKGMELKNGVVFWNLGLQLGHFQHWCAGMAILMGLNLTLAILQHGITMEGWAQYIVSNISNANLVGIVNVYAAQTFRERAFMWRAIVNHDLNPT
jgi:hypothetical protein